MFDGLGGGDFKIIAFIPFLLHHCQFKFIWDVIFLLTEVMNRYRGCLSSNLKLSMNACKVKTAT